MSDKRKKYCYRPTAYAYVPRIVKRAIFKFQARDPVIDRTFQSAAPSPLAPRLTCYS